MNRPHIRGDAFIIKTIRQNTNERQKDDEKFLVGDEKFLWWIQQQNRNDARNATERQQPFANFESSANNIIR